MSITIRALSIWFVLAVITTILCGFVYVAVQQNLRQNANDPQIQLSEDLASKLASGAAIDSVIPHEAVDIEKSLATFVLVANNAGESVQSSGELDGQMPKIPLGVFEYVRSHGQDRVTWQPKTGVRQAIVVSRYEGSSGSGFVVVGRSLREVERRERELWQETGIAWVATLGVSLVLLLVGASMMQKEKTHHHTRNDHAAA